MNAGAHEGAEVHRTPVLETEDEYQIDWSPRRAAWWAVGLYGFACALRLLLNRSVQAPYIFNDEFRYLDLARSAVGPLGLYWNGQPAFFPCWVYPLLIAPAAKLIPFTKALVGIQLINTLVINLAVPMTYVWGREVISRRRAVLAAALVALLPSMGYSATIMSECAFMPAMTLALWLAWRQLVKPRMGRGVAAGLAAALALNVKPHALLLPGVLLAAAIVVELQRVLLASGKLNARERHVKFFQGMLRHWGVAAGFALGLLPRLAVIHWIEHPGQPFEAWFVMGLYTGMGFAPKVFSVQQFIENFWVQIGGWFVGCGVVPGLWLWGEWARTLRRRFNAPRATLAWLTVIATVAWWVLVARHMVLSDEHWLNYERYMFILYAPVMILFASRVPLAIRRAWRPLLFMAVAVPVAGYAVLMANLANWNLSSNAPGMSGPLLLALGPKQFEGHGWVFLLLAIGSAVALAWPLRPSANKAALIVLLLALNLGWYGVQIRGIKPIQSAVRKTSEKIAKAVTDTPGSLYVLSDKFSTAQFFHYVCWQPGRVVSWRDSSTSWLGRPFNFNAAGQRSFLVEEGTIHLVTSPGIEVAGHEPVDLDRAWLFTLMPGETVQLTTRSLEAEGLSVKQQLALEQLEFVGWRKPPNFIAGKLTVVEFTLRNRGTRPTPGNEQPLYVGYHWSDPPRTGSWTSVVWDDGRAVEVPGGVLPGQTVDLKLHVMSPEPASTTWQFSLGAYLRVRGRHFWGGAMPAQPTTPVVVSQP